jgi:hypothetical protein
LSKRVLANQNALFVFTLTTTMKKTESFADCERIFRLLTNQKAAIRYTFLLEPLMCLPSHYLYGLGEMHQPAQE